MIKKNLLILILGIIVIVPINSKALDCDAEQSGATEQGTAGTMIISISKGNSVYSTSFTGNSYKVSCNSTFDSCGSDTVTITYKDSKGKQQTRKVSVNYKSKWTKENDTYWKKNYSSPSEFVNVAYDSCTWSSKNNMWNCSRGYKRCGGTTSTENPPETKSDIACWTDGTSYWWGDRYDPSYSKSSWDGWSKTNRSQEYCKSDIACWTNGTSYWWGDYYDPSYSRSAWDGWSRTNRSKEDCENSISSPSPTTYDYCCVQWQGEDYKWVTGSKELGKCDPGYHRNPNLSQSDCRNTTTYDYCCVHWQGEDYKWVTGSDELGKCDIGYHRNPNLSQSDCRNPNVTPSPSPSSKTYDYCCVQWQGNDYKWVTGSEELGKCDPGYHRNPNLSQSDCRNPNVTPSPSPSSKPSPSPSPSPSSKPSPSPSPSPSSTPTPIPTYDYCCVNYSGDSTYEVNDATSVSCRSGYQVEDLPCPRRACYAESTSLGDVYHWTIDSSQGSYTRRTKSQCVNCYGNGKYLSLSTEVSVQDSSSTKYPNVFPNVTNMAECAVISDPPVCKPDEIPASVEGDGVAKECEGDIEQTIKDGKNCSGNSFYSIDCTTTTITTYDNGNDGNETTTVHNMLVGQGFGFGITSKTTKECIGNFNVDTWKSSYNTINKKIGNVRRDCGGSFDSCKDTDLLSEYNRLTRILDKIYEIVESYNNSNPIVEYNETSSISIEGVDGKNTDKSENFMTLVISNGDGAYVNKREKKLGVSEVQNPYDFVWSNESSPRIVKMMPTVKYIDSFTGEVASEGIDGGNKIFIDYRTDLGEYTLKVETNGVGGKSNTITNNLCKINVDDITLQYRPIDVANPFINSAWQKGINWTNEEYDFTSTIKAGTWSFGSLNSIYLTEDQILNLKSSTKSNRDQLKYYSLCENPKITNRDSITQYICNNIQ